MESLIHPTYFPNIAHFSVVVNSESVMLEVYDNYQKQTFRNRTEIYGANGKLALTVPVIYTQKNRQLYKDVKIANENKWQSLHLKSLQSAYSMSPFYEFYIDELLPLFEDTFDYILDLNLKCFAILKNCLDFEIDVSFTEKFEKSPSNSTDFRHLVDKNFNKFIFKPYTQVFTEKHGFIPNLSILDLLFNEGPNSISYLKNQHIL